ncbi:flavin reductase like domain-containing protein [Thermothelomyces heterothallicus CBS 202.75]|uniref:flavin reductase like domain-containing protein n=1 Tax=Thermothelomyces heterothallicus CBS 202.75 TaxID=1149848 RepID=UPI00374406D2
MSSPRVLVGLTTERISLVRPVQRCNHGSLARTCSVRPTRSVVAAPSPLASGRTCGFRQPSVPIRPRAFHTTVSKSSQHEQRRHPRTFHLTDPQPPTIHPHSSSSSSSSSSPDLPLSEQLRAVMRLLTHPVVVCTATHPRPERAGGRDRGDAPVPRAMTMSSFTSLALSPTPLVSFNIAVPSRTHDAVAASRRFNIHVLADDAAGARVADWFAGGNAQGREVFDRLVEEGDVRVRWGGVGGADGGDGNGDDHKREPPVLQGDGVLYVLRCKLLDDEPSRGLVRVKDHVIVIGEVLEIVEGTGAKRGKHERFGLLYADRRYRQLGGCIMPGKNREGSL